MKTMRMMSLLLALCLLAIGPASTLADALSLDAPEAAIELEEALSADALEDGLELASELELPPEEVGEAVDILPDSLDVAALLLPEEDATQDEAASNDVPADSVPIDSNHFPDAVFREHISGDFDTDGDGYLSPSEIAGVTVMDYSGDSTHMRAIYSMKGIEYFTALRGLSCSCCAIEGTLDLSKNTSLTQVFCAGTYITSLILGVNPNLTILDVHGNSNLKYVSIHGCSQLLALFYSTQTTYDGDIAAESSNHFINGLSKITFYEVPINSITLSATDNDGVVHNDYITVPSTGATVSIDAKLDPSDATQTLEWTSSDELVATVDQDGVVTVHSMPGQEYAHQWGRDICITATAWERSRFYSRKRTSATFYIKIDVPQEITSLKLVPDAVNMVVGEYCELTVNVTPKSAYRQIDWSSSDESVVTWDLLSEGEGYSKAIIIASKPGAVTITAKDRYNDKMRVYCKVTVTGNTSVTLNKTKATVRVGKKCTLTATVTTKDGTNPGVTWFSSDKTVATVSEKGVVTAKKPGVATITAKAKDGSKAKATCKVTVPSTVILNKTKARLSVGKKCTLCATVTTADGTDPGVTWSSSDETVATVTTKGVVTAKKPGVATITAKAKDSSGTKATCKVTVSTTVKVDKSKLRLYINKKGQLTATVITASGKDTGVSWSSNDKSIATVNSAGLVTAKAAGVATITAKAKDGSGAKATCQVTVVPNTKVTLNKTRARLKLGKTLPLKATVTNAEGNVPGVYWTSSDRTVATVNSKGVVTPKMPGTVTISATARDFSGYTANCEVEVYEDLGTTVKLNLTKTRTKAGDEIKLQATCVNEKAGTFPSVTWQSSDSSVASVDSTQKYTCKVTTHKVGTATVTATATDGSKAKATCEITVVDKARTTVTLTQNRVEMNRGGVEFIYAKVDNNTGKDPGVTWSSSNKKVATVKSGMITAEGVGNATITATAKDGSNVKATCKVTVTQIMVNSIKLNKSKVTLKMGQQFQLKATVGPANAFDKAVKWTTSNELVASVEEGRITATSKAGTATITATARDGSGVKATCTVKVTPPVYRALLVSETHYRGILRNEDDIYNAGSLKMMKNMLNGVRGAWGGGKIKVTTAEDLTAKELKKRIEDTFAGADEDDFSIFYIATHGDWQSTGAEAGALTMSDGRNLNLSVLRDWLEKIPGDVIVILSSCGSGAAITRNGLGQVDNQAAAFDEEVVRVFAEGNDRARKSAIRANTGEFLDRDKFYVLTSCEYRTQSYWHTRGDDLDQAYHYFTKWLTEGVGKSGNMPADRMYWGNNNGIVELDELYKYISEVGNNTPITVDGEKFYQHVQVYPNYGYQLFR